MRLNVGIICFGLLLSSAIFAQTPAANATTDVTKDPLYKAKGDNKRSYWFADAKEQSPYRVYVPTTWDGKKQLPMVVVLHGGGLTQDAPFDRGPENLKGILVSEAEKHSFIVMAPMGYRSYGGYGSEALPPQPPKTPATAAPTTTPPPATPPGDGPPPAFTPETWKPVAALSEKDVLNVIDRVEKEYKPDPKRIYLMGNSMGELGTLHLTQKYPKKWRAIAASGGPVSEYPFQNVKGLPGAMFIQGELDKGMGGNDNIARQKALADGFQAQGVDTRFVLVPGGNHSNAWYMVLSEIFDFFEKH